MTLTPLFCHTPGPTFCAFSPDGQRLVTAGDDFFARIYTLDEEGQVSTDHQEVEVDSTIQALSVTQSQMALAVDAQTALYNVKTAHSEGMPLRCTLPVRCVAYSPDGSRLAIAADDMTVKIVDVSEHGGQPTNIKGHAKSVKAMCWNTSGTQLAMLVCDGSLRVVNVASRSEPTLVKAVSKVIQQVIEPEMPSMSIAWHPDGRYVAVPGDKDVKIVETQNWTVAKVLGQHEQATRCAVFCPNGKYLATLGADNLIAVWDSESWECVSSHKYIADATMIAWHPKQNTLAISDQLGQLCMWKDAVPADLPGPHVQVAKAKPTKAVGNSRFVDDKADVEQSQGSKGSDGPRHEDEDEEMDDDLDELENFIVDDDDNAFDFEAERRRRRELADRIKQPLLGSSGGFVSNLPKLQEAFQPNSTPVRGNRRYLALNMLGSITSIDQNTHHSIDVEFHDSNQQRPVHFKDHYGFNVAAMNERGAIFGCRSRKPLTEDGQETPSAVYFKPFDGWPSSGEWTVRLPKGEEVQLVALGSKWACVASSAQYLRFFSLSGAQTYVMSLAGGPVLTMAGSDDRLMIVRHSSPHPGAQLEYELMDVNSKKSEIASASLPLSPSSTLEWIGFSDLDAPCSYDSLGVLRMCFAQDGYKWVPVLDTRPLREGKQDYYWPVGVSDTTLLMVICKAGERMPPFPKAIISDTALQVPMIMADNGTIEEQYFRNLMAYRLYRDLKDCADSEYEREAELLKMQRDLDKLSLTMFSNACKTKKTMRALECCMQLFLEKSIRLAYKVAAAESMPQLSERIEMILQTKFSMDQTMDVEEAPPAPAASVERPAARPRAREPLVHPTEPAPNSTPLASTSASDVVHSSPLHLSRTSTPRVERVNPFKKLAQAAKQTVGGSGSLFDAPKIANSRREEKRTLLQRPPVDAAKKRKVTQSTLSFAFKKPIDIAPKETSEEPESMDAVEPTVPEDKENEFADEDPNIEASAMEVNSPSKAAPVEQPQAEEASMEVQ